MSEQSTASGESMPKKPDISFQYEYSTFEVFDLDTIRSEQAGRLYDRSDFGGNIERVIVDEEKVMTNDEASMALKLTVSFDKFKDQGAWMKGVGKRLDTHSDPQDYEGVRHARYLNQMMSLTSPEGMRLLAFFDFDNKTLVVSNYQYLSTPPTRVNPKGESFGIEPLPLESMDAVTQLTGFGKLMIRVLDAASTSPDYSSRVLIRTYRLGERITNPRTSAQKALGGKAITGSTVQEAKYKPRSTNLESFSDVILGGDEKIMLDDIGGLESVKSDLKDVALSFKHQEIMAKWGATRPQGVLLYGEPGTGKTMLAEALATEIEAKLIKIQSSDIYQKWLGDSETKIKELFSAFKELNEPTVILFDEIDAIVGITAEPSPGGADNARNAVAGIFKQEMNDLAKVNPNVLIVATSNHVDRIDPSLIRSGRFDHRIYVPMPDNTGRLQIISSNMARRILSQESSNFKVFADDIDLPAIVGLTDGMSGADIAEVFRRISFSKAMQEARSQAVESISQDDLVKTIKAFRRESL